LFRAFFPPFFGDDIRVNIKKFFGTFSVDFYPNIFCPDYSCTSVEIVSRVFFPPFFGHDIRVNMKNVFSTSFRRSFPIFFARTIRVFLEQIFRGFFPLIFWSRYSCEYKKTFFAHFSDEFCTNIFC